MNKYYLILAIVSLFYQNTVLAQDNLYLNGKIIDVVTDTIQGQKLSNKTCFIVDNLKLDSTLFYSLNIDINDIKSYKINTTRTVVVVKIKLLIIVNGQLLSTQKDKKTVLSTIDKNQIKSIIKIDKEEAVSLYGKKGKYGALFIIFEEIKI
jgi:hypothetical protein